MTWSDQKVTLSLYFYISRSTPDPPCYFPRLFLIIVIGSMGLSYS